MLNTYRLLNFPDELSITLRAPYKLVTIMVQEEQRIGHVIRVLRTAANLKQKDLARQAGIKANYLSLVEAGKREPSVTVLRAIAKALNVPIRMLFWEAEQLPEMSSVKEEDTLLKIKQLLLEMEALRLADHARAGK